MRNCPQAEGQNILEHGISVNRYFCDLLSPEPKLAWHLPGWFEKHRDQLVSAVHPASITHPYTVYHDCGKPFCITRDSRGTHFPNHAEISRSIYFSLTQDQIVSNLIGWDMALHTGSAVEIDRYIRSSWTKADAATLLLVALSEIHSNASLFGGLDSTSFKIKLKNLDRRGKQVCKYLFDKEEK